MNAMNGIITELSAFQVFNETSKNIITELCQDAHIVFSRHRECLFEYGKDATSFGIVLSGAYKLTKPSDFGDDVIVYFSTPGDVVAAFIMAQPHPVYPVSVIALGPSRFLKVSKDCYLNHWKKNPNLIFQIQNLLSTRMHLFQNQKAMIKAPLSQKIAILLINLLEKYSNQNELILNLPLTRKEIADNLGSSIESVIRIMSEWSKQGIIETVDQKIHILKPDKLFQKSTETIKIKY